MAITIIKKKVPSCNGKNQLAGKLYIPEGEIKGYFHVVHGMTDHINRYDQLMRELAEKGYLTFGYDHLGHGYTVNNDSEFGFIAERGGDELLTRDVLTFAEAVFAEYGEHPYYLMGHSMGSFIARMAVQKYIIPDKFIIMGTSGPNPILGPGLLLCKLIRYIKGPRHVSRFIENIAFGSYNDHFKEENDPKSWLTNDVEVRKKYVADRFCRFKFTISAMHDLISLNKNCNSNKWFKSVADKMPILFLSGEEDPVGDYGRGIYICDEKLIGYGADVTVKLYPEMRHEILNDECHDEVVSDILEFLR